MDTIVTEGLQVRNPETTTTALKARYRLPRRLRNVHLRENTGLKRLVASRVLGIQAMRWAPITAALLAVFSVSLTGCRLIGGKTEATEEKPASTPGTAVPQSVPAPAEPAQPPKAPSRAVPNQPTQLAEAKRPTPTTSNKGAEKLVAPNPPAIARPNETASHPAENSAVVSPATSDVAPKTRSSVRELVVKGPPRARSAAATGRSGLLLFGLLLGAGTVGIGASIVLKRGRVASKPSKTGKEELVMPKEFLLKEPAPLPREPMTFDRM